MKRKTSLLFGIILVGIALFVILRSRTFPPFVLAGNKLPGPGFFPVILSILLGGAGIYECVLAFRQYGLRPSRKYRDLLGDWGNQNILIIILGLILYVLVVDTLGYLVTTFVFSVLLMVRLKTGWFRGILVSSIVVALIMVIFVKVFKIQLPYGIFGIGL